MVDYYFNTRTGRYHNKANNVFVGKGEVEKFIDFEQAKSKVRMQGYARLLVDNKIQVNQFQELMTTELKRSHLRLGMLASGGRKGTSRAVYGSIGQRLREEYDYLKGFVGQVAAGELTDQRIIWRAGLYSNSGASAFFKSEQVSRVENGARLAKRELDPNSKHCPDCPALSTNGRWLPVDQVTPPTRDCVCRSRCRCTITYRTSARAYTFGDRLVG